ncbi:MAG: hypothetical protein B7733_24350 [Myxococcales bacterium FL481]|nr:MAG: hypothetical protein B7733_24350 [Myxococcales bacterium FL481]
MIRFRFAGGWGAVVVMGCWLSGSVAFAAEPMPSTTSPSRPAAPETIDPSDADEAGPGRRRARGSASGDEPGPEIADASDSVASPPSRRQWGRMQADGAAGVAPMRHRLGIGALRTVSGLNGLTARFYLARRLSLGAVGGLALFTHGETGDDGEFNERRTVGLAGAGLDAFFWPVQGDRRNQIYVDVGLGLRTMMYVGFDRFSGEEDEDDEDNTIDRPLEIDVEIPVATQVFIGPNVAFLPEFGVVMRIIPGSREADQQGNVDENPGTGIGEALGTTNGPGFGIEFGTHAGMFIGLGVIYYFGGR